MKKSIFLLYFFPTLFYAQNSIMDTISNNAYIIDYSNRFNMKFEVSNEKENYKFSFFDKIPILSPNIGLRYALGFNYKFLSLRLGIRPSLSNEKEKGKSDVFSMKIKLLFDKWSHRLRYNHVRGYYIRNSDDFEPTIVNQNYQIRFPDMATSTFSGTSAYKFNDNFSVKAIESQSEIQIKSVGTFMPSIDYWFYKITGTQKYINRNDEKITREKFNDFKGINTIINAGYYYTFVYHKNWYLNAFVAPGVGMDLYKINTTTSTEQYSNNYTDFIFSFQSGGAIGYNSERYYFGADFNNRITSENYSENKFPFSTSSNSFHIFLGYRFNPPKTVSKTVKKLEENIPILDKDQNKI